MRCYVCETVCLKIKIISRSYTCRAKCDGHPLCLSNGDHTCSHDDRLELQVLETGKLIISNARYNIISELVRSGAKIRQAISLIMSAETASISRLISSADATLP